MRKEIYLGIRSDDIECVYQSSKRIIFTNEDCSTYIDTKKEALILFLKTRNFEFTNNLFHFLNPIFNFVWNSSLWDKNNLSKDYCWVVFIAMALLFTLWNLQISKTFYYLLQIIAHAICDSWFWKWKTTFLPKVKSCSLFQALRVAKCTWGDNRCTWPLECTPISLKHLVFNYSIELNSMSKLLNIQ